MLMSQEYFLCSEKELSGVIMGTRIREVSHDMQQRPEAGKAAAATRVKSKVLNCSPSCDFVVILDTVKNYGQMQPMQLQCSHRDPKSLDIQTAIAVGDPFLKT
ncbi:hypothetical protein E2542_SST08100 [Spatholobus suberectus]|nr:hypothetical protein E2542_SST08100 [Spatholobus suberectus]